MQKLNRFFIWVIVVLLLGVTFSRRGFMTGRFVWWVLAVVGLMALHWVWFSFVPRMSLRIARGDRQRQRLLLRWVVSTPSPRGFKSLARFMLGVNDQVARRYSEAETQYRSLLAELEHVNVPGLKSQVQQRLADTLEALGRFDESAIERQRAKETLQTSNGNFVSLEAKGKLLERENRHAEAYEAYEQALSLVPAGNKAVRSTFMMRLVLTAFNAGRPADSLRWAETLIATDEHGSHTGGARRMAAVACNNLGRLADAEKHARLAAELAGDTTKRAESLAILAEYVMRRGDLAEAERIALEAESLNPGMKRVPAFILAEIAKERGDLEEALARYEAANRIPIGFIPASNRRAEAVVNKELAVLHARLGRSDEALELIRQAETELGTDPKLKVMIDAAAAVVHAARHEPDEARARIDAAENGLKAFSESVGTRRSALYVLADAALRMDDPRRSESFLRAYLDLNADPIYHAYAYYQLAECRRRLGDVVGGRILDRKAAATSFGTLYERLARERLAAEDVFA